VIFVHDTVVVETVYVNEYDEGGDADVAEDVVEYDEEHGGWMEK